MEMIDHKYCMPAILKQILGEAIPGFGDQGVDPSEFVNVNKPIHKDEVIDHGKGVVQKFANGDEFWYKDGQLHRDGDLPAVICSDDTQQWFKHGNLHRDGDLPAAIYSSGTRTWYKNGLRHRDNGPAVVSCTGYKEWWKNGTKIKASRTF